MQGGTAKEEGTAAEDDGTAAEASDQEEMMRIEADDGCGSVIRDEVAAQKQRGDGGAGKETDNHHLLEEAAAADGEGGNDRAGMLGDVFLININNQK